MNKDYRNHRDKLNENQFICKLRQNKKLYYYANKILFNYIQCALNNGLSKKNIIDIISIELLTNKSNKSNKSKKYSRIKIPTYTKKTPLITKNGYNCTKYDCSVIFNFKTAKELTEYNLQHNISILQITSSYYKFQINNIFFTAIYKKDPILNKQIVDTFNHYFFTTYTFDEIDAIVKKSEGHWFYTWLLMFLSPTKNLMHRNSNEDKDYIRKWVYDIQMSDIVQSPQKKLTCVENMYEDKYNIMTGDSYMKPVKNGVFWNVMKNHKKEIIAGLSSSTVLCYNSIFNVTRILKKTNKNKVIVLCLILLDYYQLHHSISEILGFYSIEAGFNDYKLDNNDLDYVQDKIQQFVPDLLK